MPIQRTNGTGEPRPGTCILHIGMPKTGTTSIQESLRFGLKDKRFLYFGFGETNGSRGITTLFGEPSMYFNHLRMGLSSRDIETYRRRWFRRLEQAIAKASADCQSLILSGETGWLMSEAELARIRQFMEDRRFRVKTIAYLRPWKARMESAFSENVKAGFGTFRIDPRFPWVIDYRERIRTLDRVFGPENVDIHVFNPSTFPEGCVVSHFCERQGIEMTPASIRRSNEALSLRATRLLYAHRKMGPGFGKGMKWLLLDFILLRRLEELKGRPLRLHSSLVESRYRDLSVQIPWLTERLGSSLEEDIQRHDDEDCIRGESDLFAFDKPSLEWLAAATKNSPAESPSEVAAQMHRLRSSPSIGSVRKFLLEGIAHRAATLKRAPHEFIGFTLPRA